MQGFLQKFVLTAVLGVSIGAGFGLTQVFDQGPSPGLLSANAQTQSQNPNITSQSVAPTTPLDTATDSTKVNFSSEPSPTEAENFDFFSDKPVESKEIVVIPPANSKWLTVGGPLALLAFMGLLLWVTKILIPFEKHTVDINLRNFPPAAKRGMAIAVVLFGIAFTFGASQVWYQMQFFSSSAEYIASMSMGKLIVMTHAHLFGFTTAFFIVGIPFSMQFNHIRFYQWIFPIGLAASLTDVMSWWGIKYLDHSFEWVSMVCALLFSGTYLFMLIGLLRTLAFPEVIWASDKDRAARIERIQRKRAASKEFRKFFDQ
jgi:hypothetical protein